MRPESLQHYEKRAPQPRLFHPGLAWDSLSEPPVGFDGLLKLIFQHFFTAPLNVSKKMNKTKFFPVSGLLSARFGFFSGGETSRRGGSFQAERVLAMTGAGVLE
ncbi:MAG: hypothetical protein U9P14_05585 [Gemmatimonadota bacterium]|nr:hypothetical protein [Gemmatimonadota bacterium]